MKPAFSIIVGGARRKVGKTSLICGLIQATPEIHWTAVKVTSHDHGCRASLWEETQSGQGTDTARYRAAGAHRALLVTALPDRPLPISEIEAWLGTEECVIVESNRIAGAWPCDLCLAVGAASGDEEKPSFARIKGDADAFVCGSDGLPSVSADERRPIFVMPDMNELSPAMTNWFRERIRLLAAKI